MLLRGDRFRQLTKGLPKTGQTTVYRGGDDGTFQAGWNGLPAARFVDNGNGTVTDHATNLMWVKQPEVIIPGVPDVHATNRCQIARGNWAGVTDYALADLIFDAVGGVNYYVCAVAHTSGGVSLAADIGANPTWWRQSVWTASAADLVTPATMDWDDTIDNSLALVYAGHDDWRLPNIKELVSIVDYGENAPAIDAAFFPNILDVVYWSSTTSNDVNTRAYWISLGASGQTAVSEKDFPGLGYALPVRGGIHL